MTKRFRDQETSSTEHPLPHEEGRASPKRCRKEEGRMFHPEAASTSSPRGLPEWRKKLWLLGMGYEELLLGWFPFVEEDFCEEKEVCFPWGDLGFDDIWQIKHITEIPTQSQSRRVVL